MKKILYSIFVLILCSNPTFGQTTPLMSDEAHRIMMNDYATNLNTILTAECPQGITIDQFKKKIVNGEITLSSTAQTSILTYAEPLKTYGVQFASTNNLTATTDAEKIFLSSFAPSTVIQNGKLIESISKEGLTSMDMWNCALNSFKTSECNFYGLVSDKKDIMVLKKSSITFLTQYAGDTGVLVLIGGFRECLNLASKALKMNDLQLILKNIQTFQLNGGYQKMEDIPIENIQVLISPLIENGRLLQSEIINSPESLNVINNLAFEEKNEFLNLDDIHVAQLSFYIAIQQSIINNNVDWSIVESFPIKYSEFINSINLNVFGQTLRLRSNDIIRGYIFNNNTGCYSYGTLYVDNVHQTTLFIPASYATQILFPKICPPNGSEWARKKL